MSTKIISIDPGKRRVGYAVWSEDGDLLDAGLVTHNPEPDDERAQIWKDMAYWVNMSADLEALDTLLVVEIPQVYEGPQEEDRNDLIDLAGVVGALTTYINKVEWSPQPREWKGQLPKEITKKRVDQKLKPEEHAKVNWPKAERLRHNVYDAIHLGLTYFEREGIRT